MKKIFTFLAFVISLNAFAQNSNLIVFNNGGQQFFVILNGIKQNAIPKTNVKIEGLSPAAYKVKIIFADGKTGDIDKNVYLEPNMEYSAQVVIKNAKKRSLRLFDIVALNTSPYGNGAETITYRPNEGAIFSDQTSTGSAGTSTSTGGTTSTGLNQPSSNGQVVYNQNGTVQTGGTTGQSGTVQSNVDVNGQPQVTTNVTATGNAQNGTVQTSTGMNGQQTGNVQMNVGVNGQTAGGSNGNVQVNVHEPDILVDLNMPMGYSQTSVTNPDGSQTITTTVNGQTTTITTSAAGTGGQVNTNISETGINGQTATQTTTTSVNGQTTQVTTNVTGNGQATAGGTHTHADGTVHDHNHNVVTTANGQTTTVSTGTHAHADGTVHNANHQVVNNGQVQSSGTHTHADGTVHDEHHNPVHAVTTLHKPSGSAVSGDAIINPNGTLTCNSAVTNIDYLVNGIKDESFSEDQMDLVKTELRSKCINSDQAYRIVNAFTFDGDKIAMSKFCFDHMTDKNNASKLLDLFQFSSSKDELKKYFGK